MSGKMTDEELERTLGQIEMGEGIEPVLLLRAHIAALTAERDEAQEALRAMATERDTTATHLKMTHHQIAEVARLLDPDVTPDGWGLHAAAQKVLAERDEAVRSETTTREAVRGLHLDMDNAGCPGTNRPIEDRVELLWKERDALRERVSGLTASLKASLANTEEGEAAQARLADGLATAADEAVRHRVEADALRERVKVLEADLDHSRKTSGKALVEARERATSADRSVEVWRTECRAAESRLAAIRQRAGDTQSLWAAVKGRGSDEDGASAVARYIVGEDAPAQEAKMDGLKGEVVESVGGCANQSPRSEESQRHLTQVARSAEQHARTLSSAEPTTAEAFASIKREWGHGSPASERNLGYVSLLERRMGAMERAARRLCETADDEVTPEMWADLQAALTDVPPVFTLGEVRTAFCGEGAAPTPDWQALANRLTTLRR